jgi:hypothetical protein
MRSMDVVQGGGPLRSLGARTVDEVLQANRGRARFLVEGLVHATTTLVYGLSEAGKSWLMVDLIAAVVRGESWLGQPVNGGPQRCLVLPADSGGIWEYAERLGDGYGGDVLLDQPPPVNQRDWSDLASIALMEGVGLVVVDNLYSWAGAVDMNANAEVARPLACLGALADTGVAVVLVHHTNSAGRKPAGVHSIPAFFRHSLAVTPTGIRSHGNDAPGATYWLTRDGGRVLDGGPNSTRKLSAAVTAVSVVGPPAASARHQQALAVLQQAPEGSSQRALGRYLRAHMASVSSEDAGVGLVKALIKKGLWPPPPGETSTPAAE